MYKKYFDNNKIPYEEQLDKQQNTVKLLNTNGDTFAFAFLDFNFDRKESDKNLSLFVDIAVEITRSYAEKGYLLPTSSIDPTPKQINVGAFVQYSKGDKMNLEPIFDGAKSLQKQGEYEFYNGIFWTVYLSK
jgi:hypothetical protein